MAKPKEVRSEEQTEEQRAAHMELIFQKLGGFLGSKFGPYLYGNRKEQLALLRIKGLGVVGFFVEPRLEKGMNASVRFSLQGAKEVAGFHQIENASIHEGPDEVTFSKKGESKNGDVTGISIKKGGVVLVSYGPINSQG